MARAVHPVLARRADRKWSQAELALRAGISRAAVSAIEGRRLTPSVTAALSLAAVLECSVEELFGGRERSMSREAQWAWQPKDALCRYWEAEVKQQRLLYPVEAMSLNPIPHDGVWRGGVCHGAASALPENTLTLACCDPAAGLLAAEYARLSGFRLLIFPRGGSAALDLLHRGLVHVAGLHRSTPADPDRNAAIVKEKLGTDYRLLHLARWEEGIVLPVANRTRSAEAAAKQSRRWAFREPGSAARECLDELLATRRCSGHQVNTHGEVAQAVRAGWAEAGICVRLCADDAGLPFIPVRTESLDLCFSNALQRDPRLQALIRLLRTRSYRQLLGDLPGYDAHHTGELSEIPTRLIQTN